MTREPRPLSDALRTVVHRFARVDLPVMETIHERWTSLVGEEVGRRCRPQIVKDGVLIVAVPSGAYAERLTRDAPDILDALADLGSHCPREIRAVIQSVPRPL